MLENFLSSSQWNSQAIKRWKILSLFMNKIGWPMLYVFLSKPFKEWSFENFQVTYLAKFFFLKKASFLNGSRSNLKFI